MSQMERIPPHNEEAEKSVLGSVLIDREVYFQVAEVLSPEDFYKESHREIFDAMTELFQRSEPIDTVTLSECLKKRKSLEAVGGRTYVAMLSALVPTTANAVQYARIVREKSVLRRLISAAGTIVEESYSETLESGDVLNNAERAIFNIARKRQSSEYTDIKYVLGRNIEQIQEAVKNGGQLPGLPTGYRRLDQMTAGLQKSDLIIIAARPSMGKTAFALNITQNAALRSGARVVVFSLEMSKEQLGLRLLSMESRLDSKKLRLGELSDEDWGSINDALNKFSKADIIIDDTPGLGVMQMLNKCRRINSEKPIDLIVVDYLQMMTADRRSENRQQEITTISRYLKQLAREMECPVIVLSQLSRAVETRTGDHRPMLSDLRESGAIEQDADVVMFLYREDYYKTPQEEHNNICEIIIAKQRNGEVGSVDLAWIPRFTKFADIAPSVQAGN